MNLLRKYGPHVIGFAALAAIAYFVWQAWQARQIQNSAAAALAASSASASYIQGQLAEANNIGALVPPVAAINVTTQPQTLPD